MLLCMVCTGAWADYTVNVTGTSTRPMNTLCLNDQEIDVSADRARYQDLTASATFTIEVGEAVTPKILWGSQWLDGYVYVDLDKDGSFNTSTTGSSTTLQGDFVSICDCIERNGTYNKDRIENFNSFTINTPGTYRMRYKVDWNKAEPNTLSDGTSQIIDVTLIVNKPPYQELLEEAITLGTTTLAKCQGASVKSSALITQASQFDNTCGDPTQGSNPGILINGQTSGNSELWHSTWRTSGTRPYISDFENHYLGVTMPEDITYTQFDVEVTPRGDQAEMQERPTEIKVYGYKDGAWTSDPIQTFTRTDGLGETTTATLHLNTNGVVYSQFRFVVTKTYFNGNYEMTDRHFFALSEFQMYGYTIIPVEYEVPDNLVNTLETALNEANTTLNNQDKSNYQAKYEALNNAINAILNLTRNGFEYTVHIAGLSDADKANVTVTYADHAYHDGEVIESEETISEEQLNISDVRYYDRSLVIRDAQGTITVTYAFNPSPVTQLSDFEQGRIYTISSADNRGTMTYTANGLTSVNTRNAADVNQQFLFVEYNGSYYFYSIGADKFIYVTGMDINNYRAIAAETPQNTTLILEASTHSDNANYPVCLKIDDHHVGISSGFTPHVITHYNNKGDGGNSLRILPVEATVSSEKIESIQALIAGPNWYALSSALDKAQYYTIGSGLGQYVDEANAFPGAYSAAQTMYSEKTATKEQVVETANALNTAMDALVINLPTNGMVLTIKSASTNTYMKAQNSSDNRIAFADNTPSGAHYFIYENNTLRDYTNEYYLISSNNFPALSSSTEATGAAPIHFKKSTYRGDMYFITFNEGQNRYMYENGNAANSGLATGPNSSFILSEVNSSTLPIVCTLTYNTGSHSWTEKVGDVFYDGDNVLDFAEKDFYTNYRLDDGESPIISLSNKTFTIYCDEAFPFTAGKLCGLRSQYADNGRTTKFFAGETYPLWERGSSKASANNDLWIFEHVPNTANHFTVKNFSNGKYLTMPNTNRAMCTFEETPVSNDSKTSIMAVRKSTYSSANNSNFVLQTIKSGAFFCVGPHMDGGAGSDPVTNGVATWGPNVNDAAGNRSNCLQILPIESFTTTLNGIQDDGYYGTIYSDLNIMVPTGATAYRAELNGESLHLEVAGNETEIIPAGAYILHKSDLGLTEGSKVTVVISMSDPTPANEENVLTGTLIEGKPLPTDRVPYVLSGKNGIGFYKYTAAAQTYPVAKAVYLAPTGQVAGYKFEFDENSVTTAIQQLQQENKANTIIYDLAGRRMEKAAKGMSIINGRKVIR